MDYTVEELKRLKKEWYQNAMDTGMIAKIGKICRELGNKVPAKWGPKYQFDHGDLSLYVDDYGHYMTASYKDKMVCSTHFCEKLFVPGEWEKIITDHYPKAEKKEEMRTAEKLHKEKKELEKKLGMSNG